VVEDVTNTSQATATSTHTTNYPSTVDAGDLLITVFVCDDNEAVTFPNEGTDWNTIYNEDAGNAGPTLAVAWRDAVGDEDGTTFDITTGGAEESLAMVLRITGHQDPSTDPPEASTEATGTSIYPDSLSLSPTGGSKEYLWISFSGNDDDDDVTVFPINMGDNEKWSQNVGCTLGMASVEYEGTSFDPENYTIAAPESWEAVTVAVYPYEIAGTQYNRDATQGVSWSSSIYRDWSLTRVPTQAVGYSSSLYRTWSTSRLPTQGISFSSSIYRDWTLTRVLSQAVSYASSLYRTWSLERLPTQAISYASNVFRTWSTSRLPTQSLTYASSLFRSWTLTRVPTQAISTSFQTWAEALILHLRDATLGFSWSSQITRTWALERLLTQSVSYASTILRQWSLTRVATQAITTAFETWADHISGAITYIRDVTLGVAWSSQFTRTLALDRLVSHTLSLTSGTYRGWSLTRTLGQALSSLFSASRSIGLPPLPVVITGGSSVFKRVAPSYILTSLVTNLRPNAVEFVRNRFTPEITLSVTPDDKSIRYLALMLSIEKDDEVLLIEDTIFLYGEPVNVTYTPELRFSKGIIDLREHKYHVTVVTTDLDGDSTRTEFYIPSSKPHTVLRTLGIVAVVALFAIDLFFDEED
jgi:hypothetical protein